jgi:hypothetical protein
VSDTDSFIDEVTEELKRDRMFRLWKRYGVYVIGAIVLVVIGAAGKSWWDARQEAEARAVAQSLIAAARLEAPEARAAAFAEIAGGEKGALVARFRAAEAYVEAGDAAKAAAELAVISSDATLDRLYRDLAALKSAQIQYGNRSPAETIAALDPLVEEGAPFRLLALETRAAAHLAAGDAAAARADLELILGDEFVTSELRQRVGQFMAILGPAAEG